MQIKDFTKSEADYLQMICNFTPEEAKLFELRLAGASLDECAEALNRSLDSIKQLSRKINAKIERSF